MVGVARVELVRTLRGNDDIVRMLRIVHALLRHVRTMGRFFTHVAITTVNVSGVNWPQLHAAETSASASMSASSSSSPAVVSASASLLSSSASDDSSVSLPTTSSKT